jgi:hypothetical protein
VNSQGSDLRQCKKHLDVLDAIAYKKRYRISVPDSLLLEPMSNAIDAFIELKIARSSPRVLDGNFCGILMRVSSK